MLLMLAVVPPHRIGIGKEYVHDMRLRVMVMVRGYA